MLTYIGVFNAWSAFLRRFPGCERHADVPRRLAVPALGCQLLSGKQQAPILGVIRLDYNYPPAPGDIDFPGSYDYDVPGEVKVDRGHGMTA